MDTNTQCTCRDMCILEVCIRGLISEAWDVSVRFQAGLFPGSTLGIKALGAKETLAQNASGSENSSAHRATNVLQPPADQTRLCHDIHSCNF